MRHPLFSKQELYKEALAVISFQYSVHESGGSKCQVNIKMKIKVLELLCTVSMGVFFVVVAL